MYFCFIPIVPLCWLPICCICPWLLCLPIICPGCCRIRPFFPRGCRWDSAKSGSRLSTDAGGKTSSTAEPESVNPDGNKKLEGDIPEEDSQDEDNPENKDIKKEGEDEKGEPNGTVEVKEEPEGDKLKEGSVGSEGKDELSQDGDTIKEEAKGEGESDQEGDKPAGEGLTPESIAEQAKQKALKAVEDEYDYKRKKSSDKSVFMKPQTDVITIEEFKPNVEFDSPERIVIPPSSVDIGTLSEADLETKEDPETNVEPELNTEEVAPVIKRRDSATP